MKLWGYYAFHTFINGIKKMFRSTVIIIFAIGLGIGIIFGLGAGIIGTIVEENMESSTEGSMEAGSENAEAGFYDEEGNFYYHDEAYLDENGQVVFYDEESGLTTEDLEYIKLAVEAGAAVLVIILLFFGAYTGTKKGSDIFLMADVNFLFTAPMKPQSVLLFRLTFQMLTTLVSFIYFIFQIPNLVLNAGLSISVCLLGFLALIFAFIFQKLVSVGVYTITSTHPKIKEYVLPSMIAVVGGLVLGTGGVFLATGRDIWRTLELTWATPWSRYIPIIGWLKAILVYAVETNYIMVAVFVLISILTMVALVYGIWHIKADFYEDAMAGAQQRSEILQAAAENRKVIQTNDSKSKKKEKRKVKEDVTLKGEGAVLFFTKEVHCRKRLARFGFVTNTMLVYLLIFVVITLLGPKLWETEFVSDYCFEISGFVVMTILFFRTLGNPIQQETSMNWLFLVPENPYKKVFFAMVAGTYATFMDLLPGMIFASLILKVSIWKFLLWMAVFVTLDFMLSGVGVVIEALLPETALNQVKAAIQMMLKFFMILVVVVAVVVGVLLQGLTLGLLITLLTNIILGGVAFIIYPSLLHDGMA
jgi:hypothetical protein